MQAALEVVSAGDRKADPPSALPSSWGARRVSSVPLLPAQGGLLNLGAMG